MWTKNSQPFGEMSKKFRGGEGFLTHTVGQVPALCLLDLYTAVFDTVDNQLYCCIVSSEIATFYIEIWKKFSSGEKTQPPPQPHPLRRLNSLGPHTYFSVIRPLISCIRRWSDFLVSVRRRAAAFNHHSFKFVSDDLWSPGKNAVAIVNSGHHEGVNERCSTLRITQTSQWERQPYRNNTCIH